MTKLEQLQQAACQLGQVQKRHNGYWLLYHGDKYPPEHLGSTTDQCLRQLAYLQDLARFDDLDEQYGHPESPDPELRAWHEERDWESWWQTAKE